MTTRHSDKIVLVIIQSGLKRWAALCVSVTTIKHQMFGPELNRLFCENVGFFCWSGNLFSLYRLHTDKSKNPIFICNEHFIIWSGSIWSGSIWSGSIFCAPDFDVLQYSTDKNLSMQSSKFLKIEKILAWAQRDEIRGEGISPLYGCPYYNANY